MGLAADHAELPPPIGRAFAIEETIMTAILRMIGWREPAAHRAVFHAFAAALERAMRRNEGRARVRVVPS
jgi:hypothetical protein